MEEKKCESKCACKCACKSVKSTGLPAFLGSIIVYELAIVVILLLYICINLCDVEEPLNLKPLKKDLDLAQ